MTQLSSIISLDEARAALKLVETDEPTTDEATQAPDGTAAEKKQPSLKGRTPVARFRFDGPNQRKFRQIISKLKRRKGWSNPEHNKLIDKYVNELLACSTSVPVGIYEPSRREVARAFETYCQKGGVETTRVKFNTSE